MAMARRDGALFLIPWVFALAGCEEPTGEECIPGTLESCSCGAGGAFSSRRCFDDGTGWEPCDCAADADGDADADAEAEADGGDSDLEPHAGPLVQVARQVTLVPEAVCDVDGDGTLDNSVAELGSSLAEVFAVAFNALLSGDLSDGKSMVVHYRWIEDLAGPSDPNTSAVAYLGMDTDRPADPTDDHSGEEPFYVTGDYLDACGEPLRVMEGIRLDHGVASGGSGVFALPTSGGNAELVISSVSGAMTPLGAEFSLRVCGYASARTLGGQVSMGGSVSDLSFLETLLAGGRAFGMPMVPGLRPDVDLDGDGLESFVIDDENRITTCIDGDRTVIAGRDCWGDPRMADGFSLTIALEGPRARFAGRGPGWEHLVPEGCPSWPLEGGFFDTIPATDGPCVELDERCDPLAPSPCCDASHRCSGGNMETYRCSAPCEPSPCSFGALRGGCFNTLGVGPMCMPLGAPVSPADCTVGEEGCTTAYGATEGTACLEIWDDVHCLERCAPAAAPCGEGRWCAGLAFEPGGVCVYWPGTGPE